MGRMRAWWLLAACLVLPLSSCGKSEESEVQKALDFRTALLAAPSCAYTAQVTADFGDRVFEFGLDCTYDSQENDAALTVTGPELIAGIAAEVDGERAQVSFEETSLELGTMAGGHVAPLQLPQLLGNAWAYGYVESQARAGDGWLITYRTGYGTEELLVCTRFDEALSPRQAEVYYDGTCVLTAEIDSFAAGQ